MQPFKYFLKIFLQFIDGDEENKTFRDSYRFCTILNMKTVYNAFQFNK